MHDTKRLIKAVCIFSPNVPRQQSLAGGAGGSHGLGAKALGLLFCQQALCLSDGMSNPYSSKQQMGQRLAGRGLLGFFFLWSSEILTQVEVVSSGVVTRNSVEQFVFGLGNRI